MNTTVLRSLVEAIPMHQGLLDRMASIADRAPRHGWLLAVVMFGFTGALGQWQWCSNGQCAPAPDATLLCAGITMVALGMAMFHRILLRQAAGGSAPRALVAGAYWAAFLGVTITVCALVALLGQAYGIVKASSVAELHMQIIIWPN